MGKLAKRVLSSVLTLVMSLGLVLGCAGLTLAADEETVSYIDAAGNPQTKPKNEVTVLQSQSWEPPLGAGWYLVTGTVNLVTKTFTDDVNIILADGAQLNAAGGNEGLIVKGTMTIYGQTEQNGQLNVTGGSNNMSAGIDISADNAQLIINGGEVNVSAIHQDAPAIGGSWNPGAAGKKVIVNHGKVVLTAPTYATTASEFYVSSALEVKAGDNEAGATAIQNTGANLKDSLSGKKYVSIIKGSGPEPTYYTVSFVMNDHGMQVPNQSVAENGYAIKPADPSATGYEFKGWYADEELSTPWNFTTPITKATTIYAKWEAESNEVKYIDADGSEKTKQKSELTPIENNTGWTNLDNAGWYLVKGQVNLQETMNINEDVHLIVQDGAVLTVTGSNPAISIKAGKKLTIYGQADQTGTINATCTNNSNIAGIGIGVEGSTYGSLVINGCEINAIGGSSGPGIGGSWGNGGYNITINRGTVTATGNGGAAGIGGSVANWDGKGSNIIINGGTVKAISNGGGVGIGSAKDCQVSSNIKVKKGLTIKAGTNAQSATEVLADREENQDIANDTNFKKAYVEISGTIQKTLAASDFTFEGPEDCEYDGESKEATVTPDDESIEEDITVNYYDSEGTLLTEAPKNVGTYTVKIDVAESEKYVAAEDLTDDSWTFAITAATITVTPKSNQCKVVGNDDPTFTYDAEGAVSDETAKFKGTLSRETGEDVGKYEIKIGTLELDDDTESGFLASNYKLELSETKVYFEIKKEFTIKGTSYKGVYDGKIHGDAATSSITEGVKIRYSTDGGNTWRRTAPIITNVGKIKVKVKADVEGYDTVYDTYTLEVTAREITIVPKADQSKVYGEKEPTIKYEVENVVKGERAAFDGALAREKGEDVGIYKIYNPKRGGLTLKDGYKFKASNYTLKFSKTTVYFKVTPAKGLKVKGTDYYGEYDGQTHGTAAIANKKGTTLTYSTDGGKTWSQNVPTKTNVGTKNVIVKATNHNYEDAYDKYTLEVTAKNLYVVPKAGQTKIYGEKDPVLEYEVYGVVKGEKAVFSGKLGREKGEDAGKYAITIGNLKLKDGVKFDASNYNLVFAKKTVKFEILKADQKKPKNLVPTGETLKGKEDGSISGVNKHMEYRLEGEEEYTKIAKGTTTIENLAPGTYYVRYKGDKNHNPSRNTKVVIGEGRLIDVTFDTQEIGDPVPAQQLEYGQKVVKPEDPSAENYYFKGWYADDEFTDAWDFEEDVVTEDTVIYAKWIYHEIIVPKKDSEPQADQKALDKILQKYIDKNPGAKSVVVELLAEDEVPEESVKKLEVKANGKTLEYYNVTLLLHVDGVTTDIGSENDELIRIRYKFDYAGKKDIQVFRDHNGTVKELTEEPNKLGEFVEYDKENGYIYVTAKQYSVYAFAFNKEAKPATGDFNNTTMFLFIGIIALCAIGGSVVFLKRRRND